MQYRYKVKNAAGHVSSGIASAASKQELIGLLKQQGLTALAIIPDRNSGKTSKGGRISYSGSRSKRSVWDMNLGGKIVKNEELLIFTRDLYSLIKAGVSLVSGLDDLAAQVSNRNFKYVLEDIRDDINAGSKLSEALARHPSVFPILYIHSIQAGEQAGRLEGIFQKLTATLESDIETSQMVKNATRYPLIVLTALGIAFCVVVFVVIPKIAKVFARFGTDLPLPTRILIGLGDIGQRYGLLILGLIFVTVMSISFFIKTPKGHFFWDRLKLKMPVFGLLNKKLAILKFAGTLQMLYASGIVLTDAIATSARVCGNLYIGKSINAIGEQMKAGRSLSDCMKENKLFPKMVVRMLMMGEKTGNLETMLGEIVGHYDRDIRNMTKVIGTLIEPILTVMLGAMMMVLALGVFMPMWNVIKMFGK